MPVGAGEVATGVLVEHTLTEGLTERVGLPVRVPLTHTVPLTVNVGDGEPVRVTEEQGELLGHRDIEGDTETLRVMEGDGEVVRVMVGEPVLLAHRLPVGDTVGVPVPPVLLLPVRLLLAVGEVLVL